MRMLVSISKPSSCSNLPWGRKQKAGRSKENGCWAEHPTPSIPACGRLWWEDPKLEASLGYIVRPEKLKEGRKGREKRRRQNDGGGRAEGRGNNMALFPSVSSAQGKGIFL